MFVQFAHKLSRARPLATSKTMLSSNTSRLFALRHSQFIGSKTFSPSLPHAKFSSKIPQKPEGAAQTDEVEDKSASEGAKEANAGQSNSNSNSGSVKAAAKDNSRK